MIVHAPTDLKTQDGNMSHGSTWVPLNYGDLYSNCSSNWYSGNSSRFMLDAQYDLQHCHPMLQAPLKLGALDPAWANCFHSIGIYDPPRALRPANTLAPAPTEDSKSANVVAPSPGSQAAQRTPSPTPPASTLTRGIATDSTAPSAELDRPQSATDPVSADPNAENSTVVTALKPFIDPASAKTSFTSDPISDRNPDFADPNPTNDPASAKNPNANDPKSYDGPGITASKLANDSRSKNPATNVHNEGHDPAVVVPHSTKHPVDPSRSYSSAQKPNRPLSNNNEKPYTASSVHAATLGQAPSATTSEGHSTQVPASHSSVDVINGSSLTVRHAQTPAASTHIALLDSSDYVSGTSTIHSIVPIATAASISYLAIGTSSVTITPSAAHLPAVPAVEKASPAGDQSLTINHTVVSLSSMTLYVGTSTISLSAEKLRNSSVVTVAAITTVLTDGNTGPAIGVSKLPYPSSGIAPTQRLGSFISNGLNGGSTLPGTSSHSNGTTATNSTRPINSATFFLGGATTANKLPDSGLLLMVTLLACYSMIVVISEA